MEFMRVKFLTSRVVRDMHQGTENQTSFVAGRIYELPVRSARRWIFRGIAELAEVEPNPPKAQTASVADDATIVKGTSKGGK